MTAAAIDRGEAVFERIVKGRMTDHARPHDLLPCPSDAHAFTVQYSLGGEYFVADLISLHETINPGRVASFRG